MRLLACSDPHCGHVGGLAPPGWTVSEKAYPGWPAARRETWNRWRGILKAYGPFDAGLFLGDGIDGRGEKDWGADCTLPDQIKQAECLAECLAAVPFRGGRPRWAAVFGTDYHTGRCEQFEGLAYDAIGIPAALRGNTVQVRAGPVLFDLRHDIGGSSTPTGGDIALRKEALTTQEWHRQHGGEIPTVILRGHVHYCRHVEDAAGWHVWTLPSLQLWTRFGSKRVHGRVIHWGALIIDIDKGGHISWLPVTVPLHSFQPAGPLPRLI